MADVKVRIHTTTDRTTVIVDNAKTPKDVLSEADVDFSEAMVHLDGAALGPKDMNTSLADLGITAEGIIAVVVKTVNR